MKYLKKIQIVLRNSLDPEPDPDSDFWLDPDSMNMDPKHWLRLLFRESAFGIYHSKPLRNGMLLCIMK